MTDKQLLQLTKVELVKMLRELQQDNEQLQHELLDNQHELAIELDKTMSANQTTGLLQHNKSEHEPNNLYAFKGRDSNC